MTTDPVAKCFTTDIEDGGFIMIIAIGWQGLITLWKVNDMKCFFKRSTVMKAASEYAILTGEETNTESMWLLPVSCCVHCCQLLRSKPVVSHSLKSDQRAHGSPVIKAAALHSHCLL